MTQCSLKLLWRRHDFRSLSSVFVVQNPRDGALPAGNRETHTAVDFHYELWRWFTARDVRIFSCGTLSVRCDDEKFKEKVFLTFWAPFLEAAPPLCSLTPTAGVASWGFDYSIVDKLSSMPTYSFLYILAVLSFWLNWGRLSQTWSICANSACLWCCLQNPVPVIWQFQWVMLVDQWSLIPIANSWISYQGSFALTEQMCVRGVTGFPAVDFSFPIVTREGLRFGVAGGRVFGAIYVLRTLSLIFHLRSNLVSKTAMFPVLRP